MLDLVIVRDMLLGLCIVGILLRAAHAAAARPKGPVIDDAWKENFLRADDEDINWHKMV